MMHWYLASGDWNYWWQERIASLSWLPQVFDPGTGQSHLLSLWLDYPFRLIIKILSTLGLPWFVIEKLLWLSVPTLAIYCSYLLAVHFLGKKSFARIASLVYATNTYFLLLIGGGQLGVAWAYAFAPFAVLKSLELIEDKKFIWKSAIVNGLWLSLLVAFDLRVAYIVLLGVGLYALVRKKLPVVSFVISLVVAASVHAFWILPTVFAGTGLATLGEEFTHIGMLRFLSVADFSHALSLLHPNWPENMFGKVYFLQPEFLILPILAFAALLWKESRIRFFAILGLVGAFMAKGTQEPFGGIFEWMFAYVPGFVMFRDPTKFYLLIAVAYAILIPFVLERVKKPAVTVIFVLFWLFTIRQLFVGQLTGTFRPAPVPHEYVQLKEMLATDPVPSRTLWIPAKSPYAYFSDMHPALSTGSAFINAPAFLEEIGTMGVRYIVLAPADERNQKDRDEAILQLTKSGLARNEQFSQLAVFVNDEFSFEQTIPNEVHKQQQLANIGLLISGIALVSLLLCIRFL
jgi:hypothetical protein